jgi:hypothetical protein
MRWFASLFVTSCLLAMPLSARAGDTDDVVYLRNGGRLRGIVVEDHPLKGSTIKLANGSVRRLKVSEIREIRYYDALAAKKAACPPALPPPVAPRKVDQRVLVPKKERTSLGAMIAGIVFIGLGAHGLAVGGVAFGVGDGYSRKLKTIGQGTLIAGGITTLLGIIMTAAGASTTTVMVPKSSAGVPGPMAFLLADPRLATQAGAAGPAMPRDGFDRAGTAALPLPTTTWIGSWSTAF